MKEITEQLIKKYDDIIESYQTKHKLFQDFLEDASNNAHQEEKDMKMAMEFAKENKRLLDRAIAERDLLVNKLKP
ncbi:MAG: hypothetical protein CMC76_12415 [Flavobacteriaceae bacterium]|nr:hypothetical protein [Flavobacteriaceae bacterium]|tara:strand:+ start:4473 stop:4697 length:225 start_codon:yes stop_codon:yes gene_type:complete